MGPRKEAQAALFYEFSLEAHVPRDHLLRSIDRFVDLSSIRAHLADFYSHTGRPSVDPELLIRPAHRKQQCCPNADSRSITREEHEDAREVARDIARAEQYAISMKLRKKVEMLFAHLKRILGLGRLRLRGPCGANDEFLLAATAPNLRKLAKTLPAPQKPRYL
jgi:hypothetical protein